MDNKPLTATKVQPLKKQDIGPTRESIIIRPSGAYITNHVGVRKYAQPRIERAVQSGEPESASGGHGYHVVAEKMLGTNEVLLKKGDEWKFGIEDKEVKRGWVPVTEQEARANPLKVQSALNQALVAENPAWIRQGEVLAEPAHGRKE
jgi:hypothetical protein